MQLDLQNSSPMPLYVRLSQALRREIESGVLLPGDRLPSFAQLREEYGLHKKTIEQSHALLEADGLVVREQGRGTFVASSLPADFVKRKTSRESKDLRFGFVGIGLMLTQASPYWMRLLEGVWLGLAPQKSDGDEATKLHSAQPQLLLFDEYSPDVWEKVNCLLINAQYKMNYQLSLPKGARCISMLARNQSQEVPASPPMITRDRKP